MSHDSLILRLKQGDKEALAELYSSFRKRFIAWITGLTNCSYDEAKEIYQYAVLTLYENVVEGKFTETKDANIKTYLFSIGRNKFMADARKQIRLTFEEELNDQPGTVTASEQDAEYRKSIKKEVQQAMNDMGEPCKTVLQLFYFDGMDMEEIAQVMGYKNGNTVKNIKYKCIQRIKNYLTN